MNRLFKTFSYYIFPLLLLSGISYSCANRGSGPQGGPKDSIPPHIIKSSPKNGALNFKKNKIELDFNEIIVIKDLNNKVVFSPPTRNMPTIKAYGKKIIIQFNDSLKENTSYTIDFADAIVDNNEGNPMENFTYSFSTGETIDSMFISGYLLDAFNLNPCKAKLIGIHKDLSDTAFTTKPFDRIAKTDSKGQFHIKNVSQGNYHVFAIDDTNINYTLDYGNEAFAFIDSVFTPRTLCEEHIDTIFSDSLTIDTIFTHKFLRNEPENIVLYLSKKENPRQYLINSERKLPYQFKLFFGAPIDTLPKLIPFNFSEKSILVELNATKDTITYWLTDSTEYNTDTLRYQLHYPKTDSLGLLQIQIDTLATALKKGKTKKENIVEKNSNNSGRKKKKEKQNTKISFLKYTTNIKGRFDVYLPIRIKFETPIKQYDTNKIHLEIKKDTLWVPTSFDEIHINDIGRDLTLYKEWEPENEYRLILDSAAFYDYYGEHNDKDKKNFQIRSLEEYASLIVNLSPLNGQERLQLIDQKEKVIRETQAENTTIFEYLEPGTFYLKLYIDSNKNKKWDPGDYTTHSQPEEVFYFPEKIVLRAYWDIEETWNYTKNTKQYYKVKPKELYPKNKND